MGVHGNILRTHSGQLVKVEPEKETTNVTLTVIDAKNKETPFGVTSATLSLTDVYDLKALLTQHRVKFHQFNKGFDPSRFLQLIGQIYGVLFAANLSGTPISWGLIKENTGGATDEELTAALDVISDAADFIPIIKDTHYPEKKS